ncbi:ComEA family DNA-binding protein [Simiduia sp. 21SJ11W-1]|uniref:ComEA family DNA-binding protein n=1 Tax=Simiduia sp. 21SJ11W-1 TaxID=2909669 RepID=UPI0035325662
MRKFRNATFLFLALVSSSVAVYLPAVATAAEKPVATAQVQTVNINTATAEQLAAALKGVGLKKAQAIIEYRNKVGKFVKVEQLAEVKGIGAATIEKNRTRITLK